MNGLRRIVSNTLISLFGQFVTWTSTLLLTIAYGRFLGDAKFGELYLGISFVSLIGFPIELGFNQQLTRDVAEDPEKAHVYLWNTLLLKVSLWVILYAIINYVALVLGYSLEQRSIVAICGITLLSGSIVSTFAALHYAFQRSLYPAVGLIIEKAVGAIVGFTLLKYGASVQVMAVVLLGGSLLDVCWVAFWFFHLTGRRFAMSYEVIRKLIGTSIPFVIYGVLGVIYYRIDTVMLSLMTNSNVVGWYGAGYRLFDTLLFIPTLIMNAIMYPVFSKLSVTSPSALKLAVEKSMSLLLICSIPIALLLYTESPQIISLLYHRPEFANAVPAMQALAPGLVFLYINTLFNSVIVSTKGERKLPIMAAAALVFNLGLNFILIPLYRHVGAAVVTSLTELLLLVISSFFVPRYLLPEKSIVVIVKVLLGGAASTLVVLYLQTWLQAAWTIFFVAPTALGVYSIALVLLRTVPREDMQALFNAIRRKGKSDAIESLNILDESIYTEITHLIPIVTIGAPHYDVYTQITHRMPIVTIVPARRQFKSIAMMDFGSTRDKDTTESRPPYDYQPSNI